MSVLLIVAAILVAFVAIASLVCAGVELCRPDWVLGFAVWLFVAAVGGFSCAMHIVAFLR